MRARRLFVAVCLLTLVPGLALAAASEEGGGTSHVVEDVREAGIVKAEEAPRPQAQTERVVAGHTTFAVIDLAPEPVSPRTVNVVGHVRCVRAVGGVSVSVPAAVDSLFLQCSANRPVWAHTAEVTPPSDRSLLRPTGWEAEVVTPAGGLARTVEYAFPTTVVMPDGSVAETEARLWETWTHAPAADAQGRPFNFQLALNADALPEDGARLDVTLAPE